MPIILYVHKRSQILLIFLLIYLEICHNQGQIFIFLDQFVRICQNFVYCRSYIAIHFFVCVGFFFFWLLLFHVENMICA